MFLAMMLLVRTLVHWDQVSSRQWKVSRLEKVGGKLSSSS